MYRKKSQGWLKHYDFVLLDMLCLQIAFIISYTLILEKNSPYTAILYRNMAIFLELADIVIIFSFGTLKDVLKKGYYQNFKVTVKNAVIVGAAAALYLFTIQQGQYYSRLALAVMIVIYLFITYVVRELWKKYLRSRMTEGTDQSLMIVTTADIAEAVIGDVRKNNYACYKIAGVAIIDSNMAGREVSGIPVVADEKTAPEYVCQEWIDEVLIVVPPDRPYPDELMSKLTETGVTTHLNLTKTTNEPGKKQLVEKIGGYTVLTTTINYASTRQLFFKRCMDICAGLAGTILTGIIFVFIAPAIYINSPGPIFFAQERVGKNGKKFQMYKFRSMYIDAEERKAELMKQNKLGDGKMFKLDFDPRVIGNRILPDGTHKTGIGDFIRRTSLDEFPQFLNVLKGDMSLIGTRPPLIDEVSLYELHHRARLAIKPGITGMWQVSGRSDITDFEEVVKLDRDYISNWNVGLDIKILLKTFGVVLKQSGSM